MRVRALLTYVLLCNILICQAFANDPNKITDPEKRDDAPRGPVRLSEVLFKNDPFALMMDIEQFRQQYPMYHDMNDVALARRVHNKFYPDLSFEAFAERFGLHAVARAGMSPTWISAKAATEELARRWGLDYTQRQLMGISGIRLDLSRVWIDKTNWMNLRKSDIQTKVELILRRNGIPFVADIMDGDVLAEVIAKDYPFLEVNVGTAESKSMSLSAAYVEVTLVQVVQGGVSLNKRRMVGDGRVEALLWKGGQVLSVGPMDGMPETIQAALTRQLEAFCNDYLAANPRSSAEGMFHDLQRESRMGDSPATQKDAKIHFTPIDGNTPEKSPPLPPSPGLDSDPNAAKKGFTAEELDAMEQRERERAAMEKLSRLGFESLSNEDVENLPEEAIKKLPAIDCLAKGLSDGRSAELGCEAATMMVESMLLDLRYYLDIPTGKRSDKLLDAVKEFQRSIGAEPTGELLFGELDQLGKRCGLLYRPKVYLPTDMGVGVGGDLAIVTGTWAFQDGTQHHTPLQTSRIELNRRTRRGVEAIAQLWSFDEGDTLNLDVDINDWEILRWDADEIRAERVMGSLAQCSFTMTVDVQTKKVRMFRLPKSGYEDDWRPQILELSKGWDVSWDYWQERQEKTLQVMAPAYREAMARMRDLLEDGPDSANQTNKPVTPSTSIKGKTLDALDRLWRAREAESNRQSGKPSLETGKQR